MADLAKTPLSLFSSHALRCFVAPPHVRRHAHSRDVAAVLMLVVVGVLASSMSACAQIVRTSNSAISFEIAGASLTLANNTSAGSSGKSGAMDSGLLYQEDLQQALANALCNATSQQNVLQLSAAVGAATMAASQANNAVLLGANVSGIVAAQGIALNSMVNSAALTAASLSAQMGTFATTLATSSSQIAALIATASSTTTAFNALNQTIVQVMPSSQLQQMSTAMVAIAGTLSAQVWQIVGQTSQMVSTEFSRAVNAESQLNSTLSSGLASGLNTMRSQIVNETSRALAAESNVALNCSALTSSAIATANAFTLSMYNNLLTETSSLRADNSNLRLQLQNENSRALFVEALLNSTISTAIVVDVSRFTAAQAAIFTNLSSVAASEVTRAMAAESQVNSSAMQAVLAEVMRATTAENSLFASLSMQTVQQASSVVSTTNQLTPLIAGLQTTLQAAFTTLPIVAGTLWAWWDASDPNGNGVPVANAFAISSFVDKGPNAIHVDTRVGGVSADISYIPNVKNGRGAILFTGNAYMTSSKQTTPFAGTEGVTWFVVYRTTPDTTTRSLASLFPPSSGAGNYYNWYLANGATERWESGLTPRSDTLNTAANTWVVSVGRQGTSLGRNHMTSFGSSSNVGGLSDSMPAVNRGLMLGSYAGNFFNSYVAEMVIYNNFLSDADTNTIFNWLRAKWAI